VNLFKFRVDYYGFSAVKMVTFYLFDSLELEARRLAFLCLKYVKKTLNASNRVTVKSFIKFDDNGKPIMHDNVKLIRDRLLGNADDGPA
jgi:hypothetical protein